MTKDWIGTKQSSVVTGGLANLRKHDRAEHDFYATEPKAAKLLLELEPQLTDIWECAAGAGHLASVFLDAGKLGRASDLHAHGSWGPVIETGIDFLAQTERWKGDIVTNPPYAISTDFIVRALSLVNDGRYVCMLLPIRYLESKGRYARIFRPNPPRRIWVPVNRIKCAMNGDFQSMTGSALSFMWYVWEKGYRGKPEVGWCNE